MNRIPKYLIATPVLLISFISCFDSGEPTNTILKEEYNRSHTKKFVLFVKEYDATVADSYQLSILEANEKLDKTITGNTLVVDAGDGETTLCSTSVVPYWIHDKLLKIDFDKKLRVFGQHTDVEDVKIIYKQK